MKRLALTIFLVLGSQVHASIDDSKQVCQPPDDTVVKAAFNASQAEIARAADLLEAAAPATIDKFRRWIGAPSSDRVADVVRTLRMAAASSHFQRVWCPNVNSPEFEWVNGDLAGVHPSSSIDIFFAPDFFTLSATGLDSQSSTVSHETLHQVGANLSPEIYKKSELEQLATTSPSKAMRNAQSLEYLVIDLLFGI